MRTDENPGRRVLVPALEAHWRFTQRGCGGERVVSWTGGGPPVPWRSQQVAPGEGWGPRGVALR